MVNKKPVAITVTAMILGTIIILALIGVSFFGDRSASQTIKVTGVASLDVTPDEIHIHFSVETKGQNAKEAKDNNSVIVDQVIASLMAAGYSREEIQTSNFNIWEEYDWTEQGRVPLGFKATHAIKVSVPRNDLIGETIDAGVDSGARVSYINFALSQEKENEYKAQAIELATKDARTQATAMASGLGVRLGDIVSVSNTDFNYQPWPAAYDTAILEKADAGAAVGELIETDINPREQSVSSRVTTIYEIR